MHVPLRLNPTLPLMPGESPASFVSRLANINGISTAREFCLDMGLRFQDVVDGTDDALVALADLSGAPVDALLINAIRRIEGSLNIGNQRLNKAALRRQRLFVCALCLKEDIRKSDLDPDFAVYGRTIWLLDHIRTCPHHNFPLVEVDVTRKAQIHEFSFLIQPKLTNIDSIIRRFQHRPTSGLETYLLHRIADRESQLRWLDNLDWFVAAKTCEIIGAVAEFGRTPNLNTLSDDDWYRAGARGFEVASGDESGIRCFLTNLQETYPYTRAGTDGPQAQFGRLYQWLAFGADDIAFDPVRDLVAQHIIESMPVGEGDTVLGKTVEKRVKHSIRTASLEIKAHPKRLRKVLAATGIIGVDHVNHCDARVIFNASDAQDILAKVSDALSLRDVETYLGAGRVHAQLLMDQGFIVPFISDHAEGIWWHAFARKDLDEFLFRLFDGAVEVDDCDMPKCSIKMAAKFANCGAGIIVRLVLDKKLEWVGRKAGIHGYDAVMVDVDEIRRLVKLDEPDGITIHEACKRLSTSHRVVKALVECCVLPTAAAVNPVNRCPMNIIPNSAFSAFSDKYVSLFELTQQFNVHHLVLKKALEENGIWPAFDPALIHASFFNRSEIPETLFADVTSLPLPSKSKKRSEVK